MYVHRISLWNYHFLECDWGEVSRRIHCVVQSRCPRLDASTWLPAAETFEQEAWYPPGHGDIYETLLQDEEVQRLVKEEGRHLVFASNGDNLGATLDLRLANKLASGEHAFFCEVVEKKARDIKGGTIIHYDGRLKLLETAEVPPEHV